MNESSVEELVGDLSAIRAPRGSELRARSWQTEAPLRMLLNNLDPEVAEHPESLVVYGGSRGIVLPIHRAQNDIDRTNQRYDVRQHRALRDMRQYAEINKVWCANSEPIWQRSSV